MATRKERIEGGLIGLLVGDALGVPYEFHGPDEIPRASAIEYVSPAGFDRAHVGVPPGTWSDDGALALCLLASLLDCNRFDPSDFGSRIVQWKRHGYMAVDGDVFDIGITTSQAISAIEGGADAVSAGPAGEYDCGNGALMRVLPLVLWHKGSHQELAADAALQSRVTHGHLRSQICCALYALWARRLLDDFEAPWPSAVNVLREIYREDPPALVEIETKISPDRVPGGTGSGYVVDCLHSARWAFEQGGFEQVVRSAIALGNDTDTTACVAGGAAGIQVGVTGIPVRWRRDLRGASILLPLLDRLLARSADSEVDHGAT